MEARITSPVARTLEVRDVERSIAFYRDMLGFTVSSVAGDIRASLGPAELTLVSSPKIIRRATVFFETDDVPAMHARVRSSDPSASDVDRVNWIKIEMFHVRDPDGHLLLFGASFDRESLRNANSGPEKAIPEIPVDDVAAAVAHYRDVLGFRTNHAQPDLGVMDRAEIRVLLVPRGTRDAGSGSMYAYVRDADALHTELLSRGATVTRAPVSHPWGLRDFDVADLDGNRLTFGQPFE